MYLDKEVSIVKNLIRQMNIWDLIKLYAPSGFFFGMPISVKISKLGKTVFYIRKKTTDVKLLKLVIGQNEYGFLYETPYLDAIKKANYILDCGANIGIFTRLCRNINPNAQIVAVEPDNRNFVMLKKNNECDNRVLCHEGGIWNRDAKLKVCIGKSGEWGITVKETNDESDYSVKAITIEHLCEIYGFDYVDVLKIDIEGSEYNVFDESAENWIERVGLLIIECHDKIKRWSSYRVLDLMYKHGFEYNIYGDMFVFTKKQKEKK